MFRGVEDTPLDVPSKRAPKRVQEGRERHTTTKTEKAKDNTHMSMHSSTRTAPLASHPLDVQGEAFRTLRSSLLPSWAALAQRTEMGSPPLLSTFVAKLMIRGVKMPLRCQLDPNMAPTWPLKCPLRTPKMWIWRWRSFIFGLSRFSL